MSDKKSPPSIPEPTPDTEPTQIPDPIPGRSEPTPFHKREDAAPPPPPDPGTPDAEPSDTN